MARLKNLPAQALVDTLAGYVDYYYWKQIPVARKWPHWPARVAHDLEKAAQERFAYAQQMWAFLPEFLKAQYRLMAMSTPVTARDIFTRAYLNASRL